MSKPCQDSYSINFTSFPLMLAYHEKMRQESRWERTEVNHLTVAPLDKNSPLFGDRTSFAPAVSEDAIRDTADNLGLAIKLGDHYYPLRDTAYKSSRNGGLRRGRSRRSVQQSIFFPMWNGICTAILPRQRARTMNFSGRMARRCKRQRSPRHSDTTSTRRSDGSPHNREEPIMAQLYFKYGAMGSSKTANALMARFNYEERGQQTLLVKPQLDTRDGDHMVHSRIGLEFPCVYFHEMREMSEDELKKNACIIVDEAQFLTREEVMYLVHLVDDCGIPVMCYGLRADFRGELFPGSYELLVMADKLEEVKTICWCGKKAAFNARFDANGKVLKEGEQVVLGANDQYIGLCRRHWMAGDLGPDFNGRGTGD